jgi:Rib/alpha/Esp surface antigen-like repeat protein
MFCIFIDKRYKFKVLEDVMKEQFKKLLSILLAVMIFIGTIPAYVIAEEIRTGNRTVSDAQESDVGSNSKNAVHGFVGLQVGGDINLPLRPATGQQFKPVNGVTVYFQWYEDGGKVSPVYSAVSGEDGQFHMGIKPYLTAKGQLVKFDADPTISAGNERYRFWVDKNSIPEGYQLQFITGENVVFPKGGLPISQGGASSDVVRNTHNNWKVLLKEKTKPFMHRADAKETPQNKANGGYIIGSVNWDYVFSVGGTRWKALASQTSATNGITVRASYLSDYAMKQIFSDATANYLGVDSVDKIRGGGWTPELEEELQNWIKEQIQADEENKWIAETVTAKTDENGLYTIQFNGTWGPANNRAVASYKLPKEGDSVGIDKWTQAEIDRIGTVADTATGENSSFAYLARADLQKHVNTHFLFVSLDNTDNLRILTPFNNNTYTTRNDVWGIHSGWGILQNPGGFDVTDGPANTFKAAFVVAPDEIVFEIPDFDDNLKAAIPGDIVQTKTSGLPNNYSTDTFKIFIKNEDNEVVAEGDSVRPSSTGEIPPVEFDTSNITKTTKFRAELYRMSGEKPDQLLASDSFTVLVEDLIGSKHEEYNYEFENPLLGATYSATGLPDGLIINSGDGQITGTPTESGLFDIEISSSQQDKDLEEDVVATVHKKLLITDSPLEDAIKGVEYNQEVKPEDHEGYIYKNIRTEFIKTVEGLTATGNKISGTPKDIFTATEEDPNVRVIYDIYRTTKNGTEVLVEKDHFDRVPLKVKLVNYIATYEDVNATINTEVIIPAPTFDSVIGEQPENPIFELEEGAPEGAEINRNTGAITYTPKEVDAGKTISIPVKITYGDNTFDEVEAKIIVADSLSSEYYPLVKPIEKEQGEKTTEDDIKAAVTFPDYSTTDEQPKVTVDEPDKLPDGNTPGESEVAVTITYPDGSTDKATVIVTTKGQNSKYDPLVDPIIKLKGQATTEKEIKDAISIFPNYPTQGDQPEIIVDEGQTLPDGTKAGVFPIYVTVKYPDGTIDPVTVPITVKDEESELYDPVGQEIKAKVGDKLGADQAKSAIKNVSDLPDDAEYSFKSDVDTSTARVVDAIVVVTYKDGTFDEVPVKVTVTDMDKDIYQAEYTEVEGAPGTKVTVDEPSFKNKDDEDVAKPEGTKFAPGKDAPTEGLTVDPDTGKVTYDIPADAEGDITIPVEVTYKDGSKETVDLIIKSSPTKDTVAPNPPTEAVGVYGESIVKVSVPQNEGNEKDLKVGDKIYITTLDSNSGTSIKIGELTLGDEDIAYIEKGETELVVSLYDGKVLDKGNNYKAHTEDASGNKSADVDVTVEDATTTTITDGKAENQDGKDTTTVSGKTKPNTEVTITYKDADGNDATEKVTSASDGNFTVEIPRQADGANITLTPAGGEDTTVTVEDATTATITDGKAENQDGKDTTTVSGKTKPNTEVTITYKDADGNDATEKVTSGNDGSFTVEIPRQADGANITLTPAGGEDITVTVEDATTATITDGKAENQDGKDTTTVSGKTKPNTEVTITYPGGTEEVTSGDDGSFTVGIPRQADGTNITVTPEGGRELTIAVVDKTSPAPEIDQSKKPYVDTVYSGDTELKGSGVEGATIEVILPDGNIRTTSVDNFGNWFIDLDRPARLSDDFYVRQIEAGKEASDEIHVEVNRHGHSNFPSINWSKPTTEPVEEIKPESIIEGAHRAYLNGYPDGNVRPDGFITRAESAQIIAGLRGLSLANVSAPKFSDTPSRWYNGAVNAVVDAGIMNGYPDGSFRPNEKITRAEFAQMIKAIDKANSTTAPFEDVKGHWAEAAINQAYGNERIKGYPDGSFRPNAEITRAEAVTICNKLFHREVDAKGLSEKLKNPTAIKHFLDLDKSHWAYYEILEASSTHDYQRREKTDIVENWIEIR